MCSYIVEKAALVGSAKGRKGWMKIDTANVYFDHPYHSTLDHVLAIDFTNEAEGGRDRVAVELSADSARALIDRILAALASGEAAHATPAPAVPVAAEEITRRLGGRPCRLQRTNRCRRKRPERRVWTSCR